MTHQERVFIMIHVISVKIVCPQCGKRTNTHNIHIMPKKKNNARKDQEQKKHQRHFSHILAHVVITFRVNIVAF